MPEEREDIQSIKCTACSGDLGRSTRIEGSGEDAEEVPIAKCLSCGKEYDQKTEEYYLVYAEKFRVGLENTAMKLGAKGEIDGVEYEIIGRIRYQDEEEWELDVWDEWLAVTADGSFHWFVEEEGEVHAYEEYVPASMDLEVSPSVFEFEGRRFSKENTGFVARIVYAEGELTWKPEIGEPAQCYDFRKEGYSYTIEQSEDEVSVTRGKRVPYKKVIMAFRKEDFMEKYGRTMLIRERYRGGRPIYLVMCALSFAAAVWGCFSGGEMRGAVDRSARMVLASNQPKSEENANFYFSQVLYTKPVELTRTDALYQIRVEVDTAVQAMSREWESYRLMLIKEDKYQELVKKAPARTAAAAPSADDGTVKPDDAPATELGQVLDEVDTFTEPLESVSINGDFWDEDGHDDEGYWHESETAIDKDFLLDEPGKYYIYLELYSQNRRNPDGIKITIVEGVRSYRYFVMVLMVFIVLWIINRVKSRSYNELPFDIATD